MVAKSHGAKGEPASCVGKSSANTSNSTKYVHTASSLNDATPLKIHAKDDKSNAPVSMRDLRASLGFCSQTLPSDSVAGVDLLNGMILNDGIA